MFIEPLESRELMSVTLADSPVATSLVNAGTPAIGWTVPGLGKSELQVTYPGSSFTLPGLGKLPLPRS